MTSSKKRILIIDDSEAIHRDFRRILCQEQKESRNDLDLLEDAIFGSVPSCGPWAEAAFEVESAFQGKEGLVMVERAQALGRPYALVFLDYRMPPGWNGLETLRHLWKVAPALPVVLCSAYSDYSWEDIAREFGSRALLEMRKPFNSQKLRQLAISLAQASPGVAP